MTNKKEKLLIIDGNALIHRSFHALPPTIQTKDGEITNAVFGFTSVLLKALKDFKPEYVVLTLDKKGPTFRHEKFDAYKAKRVKAPDELYMQIPRVKEIATSFGIPIFELSGFEADDLIGTIVTQVESGKKEVESVIVTGDMDTMQLISDDTKVYTMSRGLSESVIYDKKAVKDRYDLSVEQMIDYKALRGDPSDNIPGVKGIGEKTATELLQEFKTLKGLYGYIDKYSLEEADKVEKMKPRTFKLLKEFKDDAFMSQDLATIKLDAPIEFDLEKAKFGGFDNNKVIELLSELEFKSLLIRVKELNSQKKLSQEEVKEQADSKFSRNQDDFDYHLIESEKDFDKFFNELKKQKEFTFDTETTGFDPLLADLLGISFSWRAGQAYYVNCRSKKTVQKADNLFNYNNDKKAISINPRLEKLKTIFEDEKIKKSAHNSKFDVRVIQAQRINIQGINFDTMIASYLLNPGTRQHNLDALTFTELGFEKISKDDLLGKGKDKISFGEVGTEKLSLYSCEDADFTCRLQKNLSFKLKENKLDKLFNDIEMPLVLVLAEMENYGVKVDKEFLSKMSKKMIKEIIELEKKIHILAGVEFNVKSPLQLKEILFEKLEIPVDMIKKTKTGFSTSAEELEKLKDYHEIVPLILDYRELTKLTSTYIDAIPELINPSTGRVHTSYNQTVTATGRLSSTNPNLQNIPIRTELGREIRKAFIASEGFKLLALDYSQIELRLAAHLSQDKKMSKAFQDKLDIHTATAAEVNRIKLEDVTKEMRREAKAVNFGVLYGQGPHGLSQTAGIPYIKAKEFIDNYFDTFKGVKKYIEDSIELAREKGYAETLFKRRRALPEIDSSIAMVRKGAERMAINTPLQGTSADMIKVAMIKIFNEIKDNQNIKMLMQVHDELIFEVLESEVEGFAKKAKEIMENVIKLSVPIIVDVNVGDNWGDMNLL